MSRRATYRQIRNRGLASQEGICLPEEITEHIVSYAEPTLRSLTLRTYNLLVSYRPAQRIFTRTRYGDRFTINNLSESPTPAIRERRGKELIHSFYEKLKESYMLSCSLRHVPQTNRLSNALRRIIFDLNYSANHKALASFLQDEILVDLTRSFADVSRQARARKVKEAIEEYLIYTF